MLSDSTFFVDLFKEAPKQRLQKVILYLANIAAHKKFVNYVEHIDTSEKILIESMKREEVSFLSRIFTVNLTQPVSRNQSSLQLRDSSFVYHLFQTVPLEQWKNTSADVECKSVPISNVKPQVIYLMPLEITG